MNPREPRARFDHFVVAIRSLSEGMAEFARTTGITPAIGGQHPGRGTENALASLGGGSYFEIIAPQADAALSPQDETMRSLDRLTIVTWAVSVANVDAAIAALQQAGFPSTAPQPGSRVTPSGDRLAWTTFSLGTPDIAIAPFFICWHARTTHPSTTSPAGCTLESLTLHDPASDRLAAALAALGMKDTPIADGPPRIEATLRCGSKAAVFSSRPV